MTGDSVHFLTLNNENHRLIATFGLLAFLEDKYNHRLQIPFAKKRPLYAIIEPIINSPLPVVPFEDLVFMLDALSHGYLGIKKKIKIKRKNHILHSNQFLKLCLSCCGGGKISIEVFERGKKETEEPPAESGGEAKEEPEEDFIYLHKIQYKAFCLFNISPLDFWSMPVEDFCALLHIHKQANKEEEKEGTITEGQVETLQQKIREMKEKENGI